MKSQYLPYAILLTIVCLGLVFMQKYFDLQKHEGKRRSLVYYAATVDAPCKDVVKFIKENL